MSASQAYKDRLLEIVEQLMGDAQWEGWESLGDLWCSATSWMPTLAHEQGWDVPRIIEELHHLGRMREAGGNSDVEWLVCFALKIMASGVTVPPEITTDGQE